MSRHGVVKAIVAKVYHALARESTADYRAGQRPHPHGQISSPDWRRMSAPHVGQVRGGTGGDPRVDAPAVLTDQPLRDVVAPGGTETPPAVERVPGAILGTHRHLHPRPAPGGVSCPRGSGRGKSALAPRGRMPRDVVPGEILHQREIHASLGGRYPHGEDPLHEGRSDIRECPKRLWTMAGEDLGNALPVAVRFVRPAELRHVRAASRGFATCRQSQPRSPHQ